jgi:hypothetical protein
MMKSQRHGAASSQASPVAVFAVAFLGMFGLKWGFASPPLRLMLYAFAGWGIGLVFHGLHAHEVIDFLSPKWERRMVERRLGRKLD